MMTELIQFDCETSKESLPPYKSSSVGDFSNVLQMSDLKRLQCYDKHRYPISSSCQSLRFMTSGPEYISLSASSPGSIVLHIRIVACVARLLL